MTLRVWGIFFSFCLLSVQVAAAQVRPDASDSDGGDSAQDVTQ